MKHARQLLAFRPSLNFVSSDEWASDVCTQVFICLWFFSSRYSFECHVLYKNTSAGESGAEALVKAQNGKECMQVVKHDMKSDYSVGRNFSSRVIFMDSLFCWKWNMKMTDYQIQKALFCLRYYHSNSRSKPAGSRNVDCTSPIVPLYLQRLAITHVSMELPQPLGCSANDC